MMESQRIKLPVISSMVVTLAFLWMGAADGFVPASLLRSSKSFVITPTSAKVLDIPNRQTNTELKFMGSDGGILGIGTPELFTILLVGYFVLGPSDLFKLTKEIGKFVQNVRTFSDEATSTFENNMESQLQLEEIRKAQRELNDAFNFRRSINVDAESEAFEVNAQSPRPDPIATVPDEEISADAQPKKKVRRRRVKKKKVEEEEEPPFCVGDTDGEVANNVPDLSMDEEMSEEERRMVDSLKEAKEELRKEQMEIEAAELRNERMERLQSGSQPDESMESLMAEEELASAEGYDASLLSDENAQSRFQAQLNNNWNEQILSKEDELSPLSDIMERLALLEEEKNAADNRLQEEFRLREENEEKFYREKRMLLQEAAAKIQADAYATTGPANSENV